MARGWFQRYWVVQEAALAREVVMMCGGDAVIWTNSCLTVVNFMRSVKLAVSSPQWQHALRINVDMESLLTLLNMQLATGPGTQVWSQRKTAPDVLDFVYSMRHREATDVRDRIYSLVNMASTSASQRLYPDYIKSAEQVYDEFAELVARDTKHPCTELKSLASPEKDLAPGREGQQSTVVIPLSNGPVKLDDFIRELCAQATNEVNRNGPYAASSILESAAMFLRSESFGPFR